MRYAILGVLAGIGLVACQERAPAPAAYDAGPPLQPLDAALFASPTIPVVEVVPVAAAPPPLFAPDAGEGFEGEIDFLVSMPALKVPPFKVELFVKGSQTVSVGKGKRGTLREVFRRTEGINYEVVDNEKTFERFTLSVPTPDMKVTRGTTLEKIAGGECEDWELRSSTGHLQACVTRGLGPYLVGKDYTATGDWSAVLAPSGYFALRASLVDQDGGREVQSVTVTRVVRKPVPDELFTWPSDYKDAAELDRERVFGGTRDN